MEKQAKILVIEDEASLRELYVELLTDEGYNVSFAVEGEDGFTQIKKGNWDLILLDVILPKMDGITILKELKKLPPIKTNGPIVLLTALAEDKLIHTALANGATGYLVKSDITPDQVLQEVKNFLTKPDKKL